MWSHPFLLPPSCQLMQSTTLQVMVSWAWMKMESHLGTSSATSTSWGLRYLQCWSTEHSLSILCEISCTFMLVKIQQWLKDWSTQLLLSGYCFCFVFSDRNQLQDLYRQLEYSNGDLAQDVSAANVNFSTHEHSQKTFTQLSISQTFVSAGCVMTEPPSTGWHWPLSCLRCGTVFIQGTISPSSLPSPSPWQHELWVL